MNIKTLEEIKEEIFKAFSVPKEHFDKRVIIGNEFEEWLKEKKKDSISEIENYAK